MLGHPRPHPVVTRLGAVKRVQGVGQGGQFAGQLGALRTYALVQAPALRMEFNQPLVHGPLRL
jgi:hypothetical protein